MKDHTRQWEGPPEGAPTRLRELRPGDLREDAAWAVELLREAPTHRLKPGERQRVLLGLGRGRVVTRRVWPVRLAATVVALVAATAIARAGLGHLPRWLTELVPGPRPNPQADVRPHSGVIRHRELAAAAAAPAPQIAAAPMPVPVPVSVPGPIPAGATRATVNAKRPARRPATPVATPVERGDRDAGLVVQAMRALRRDDDPALARRLCAAYLQRRPDGALAEEALALTIEAAVAQHESDAAALGARYLRQYPDGPFRGLARQATRSNGADSR